MFKIKLINIRFIIAGILLVLCSGCSKKVGMDNGYIRIQWKETDEGYKISFFQVKEDGKWNTWGIPEGQYTFLYSSEKPGEDPVAIVQANGDMVNFPDSAFKYIVKTFKRAISEVPMNRAGEVFTGYPETIRQQGNGFEFERNYDVGKLTATWQFDEKYPADVCIRQQLVIHKDGYYSLASVTPATLNVEQLGWGVVPGFYQGNFINPDFVHSYAYAQGLPEFPVLCRESTITAPVSILMDRDSCTLAVTIESGQESDRYPENEGMHDKEWRIALSHMNRDSQLTPTAYHPVLGESGSYCKAGDTLTFAYRFTLNKSGWYTTLKHTINDIYHFDRSLDLKSTSQSLTDRILAMHQYLVDDKTSHWHVEEYQGMKIGAQSYMGGVVGADNDAMKNSDIGAVWMLASLTGDEILQKTRLPYIRNFKIAQQQEQPGFFEGAARGQYYLAKKKEFVEEWGNHFEPIGLTYYTLIDIGNILLFQPDDQELLDKLKAGAERLLNWQHNDGSWPVAFDRDTHQAIFDDLQDARPTFYGMYVAYRILQDSKYLDAAIKGADWFISKAVNGTFIGVCGDVRFVNDFATAQSAQALLDLYEVTGNEKYKDVAIQIAKMYTTSIYTYPIPSKDIKTRKGREWEDWQLSQSGLSFEHGGTIGSAVLSGPILLAGHTGLFVRMFQLTGDSLFINMARAGALGRDAFVNPQSSVASYYWTRFDNGPGQFPHHAWWQVGWIMDYLVAEMEARSNGKIKFPRGFVTPKVGPHQTVGFAKGLIEGQSVSLQLPLQGVKINNPNIDYLLAATDHQDQLFLILMNQQNQTNTITWHMDPAALPGSNLYKPEQLTGSVELAPWSIQIVKLIQ